jgi:serine/threonine protein kinase
MTPLINAQIFFKQLIFLERIKSGSYGTIYKARHLTYGEVAVKLLEKGDDKSRVHSYEREVKILAALSGEPGFPKLITHGERETNFFIVMSLHGIDLFSTMASSKVQPLFTWAQTMTIAISLINRLETLHSKGFIHCDLKLDNILFHKPGDYDLESVCLIDFGLSRSYIVEEKHIPEKYTGMMVGTVKFCSINSLNGNELSRRDDLESLGYLLLFLLKGGELPWLEYIYDSDKKSLSAVKYYKKKIFSKASVDGDTYMPSELKAYFTYVKSLGFTTSPKYTYLKSLFAGCSNRSTCTDESNSRQSSLYNKNNEINFFESKAIKALEDCSIVDSDDDLPISKNIYKDLQAVPSKNRKFGRFDCRTKVITIEDLSIYGERHEIIESLENEDIEEENGRETVLSSVESDCSKK